MTYLLLKNNNNWRWGAGDVIHLLISGISGLEY